MKGLRSHGWNGVVAAARTCRHVLLRSSKALATAVLLLLSLFAGSVAAQPLQIEVPKGAERKFDDDSRACGAYRELLVVGDGLGYGLLKARPPGWLECMLARGWTASKRRGGI